MENNSQATERIFIDAGVENINIKRYKTAGNELIDSIRIPNNDEIGKLFEEHGLMTVLNTPGEEKEIYITGKVAEIIRKIIGRGEVIIPSAAIWSAAKYYINKEENKALETMGIIDLSASGYMIIAIDKDEVFHDDGLIVNPKCGAGSGVNLSRILQKLDMSRGEVDSFLNEYLGEKGMEKRAETPVRADRCGVFSSSATISDKNQGIPLDYAMAVTMKSEVMKSCSKVPQKLDKIYLTGGVFKWQYARDCAADFLKPRGVKEIVYDEEQSMNITGMKYLAEKLGGSFRKQDERKLRKPETLIELPAFKAIKSEYMKKNLYTRFPEPGIADEFPREYAEKPVSIALDIGSTMAKMVVVDFHTGTLLFKNSYNNHGDTIDTIKYIFGDLKKSGISTLKIQNIGLTGSGRYQVQKALKEIYPHLADRIFVLVENYAHARGAIQYVKERIGALKAAGEKDVNEDFCLLVDIGGEDTKVSVISLEKEELFDNAMNVKCSAGTGSLMDTLKSLFGIEDVADAYEQAYEAEKSYRINATCAVFLMENARKMQAEGYSKGEILASCTHAIVENMARTLWDQVDFPSNTVTLLHGQTMLSDPLPLAVTQRIQEYTASSTYCVVPPFPGHRACLGLTKTMAEMKLPEIETECRLDDFIEQEYTKKMFTCHGAACGDKSATCARSLLRSDSGGRKLSLKLGGCTAINEMEAQKQKDELYKAPETYKEIWKYIDNKLPKRDDEKRLVIPRSFAVSEQAFFIGRLLEKIGLPVHIDNVQEQDVMDGQPWFPIDTCAPNIGATGQFLRLAREEKGLILVPQIDFLPSDGIGLGRTCTTNQGGPLIAMHFAEKEYPEARFKLFNMSMDKDDPVYLADQIYDELQEVFEYYSVAVSKEELVGAIESAGEENRVLKEDIANQAADYIEEAISKKLNVSVVTGREYILNPGIYDSHIGKLLRDKGVVAIPSYVFETHLDKRFAYMYWRNPHDILTKINAITNKEFHTVIKNPRLKELVKKIETGSAGSLLSVITVSTFRCGPDTVTLPTINELAKDFPSLLIQSDAMIAELAHLENRVNTHLNQLEKQLHLELSQEEQIDFDIELLNEFTLDALNHDNDVLYFPTLDDNRIITAVFKAMGVTVVDNYDDATYDLEAKAKMGRKHVGDSVCVPLAAVHTDMLNAIEDFVERKKADDPLVRGKNRVVLFMHGGDGPCRLGQYIDQYKLSFYHIFGLPESKVKPSKMGQPPVKILQNLSSSLLGQDDYTAEVDQWVGFQAYQGIVVQGLFHSVYIKAASLCTGYEEFMEMQQDYWKLKEEVYYIIENKVKPGKVAGAVVGTIGKIFPKLAGPAQFVGYGIYKNNGFRKVFRKFSKKWVIPRRHKSTENDRVRIHVDGELYMRVAQLNEILKTIIDSIGYNSFDLAYSPIWVFFENILEARILVAQKDIDMSAKSIEASNDEAEKKQLADLIQERKDIIVETEKSIFNFRNRLARPMYKAAGLDMPHAMKKVFAAARAVIPTFKPFGELVPYSGETVLNLQDGVDVVFNVAPEGCMVSSMGQTLTPKIMDEGNKGKGKKDNSIVQNLSSNEGEIEEEILQLALLKVMGPERYYRNS
ncbi:MAG: hypothetical protein GY754_21035 [bacterium]|nr:hypothetical protein [bacterium]